MLEFDDPIPDTAEWEIPEVVRLLLWSRWDAIRNKRFKLHWGPLRPSWRWRVLDPLIVKLIGPRPS